MLMAAGVGRPVQSWWFMSGVEEAGATIWVAKPADIVLWRMAADRCAEYSDKY